MGYFLKKGVSRNFGVFLDPIYKGNLEEHILKMKQYNIALVEERMRVVENVLPKSPGPQQKSIVTLTRDAWDMLIVSSTISHCLRYALECINPKTCISFATTFRQAVEMTEDCLTMEQYRERAINLLLALSSAVGPHRSLDKQISAVLQDPKSTPRQLAQLVDQQGQNKNPEQAERLASHFKVLLLAISKFKPNVTTRNLSKKTLCHDGGKTKGDYFNIWLPTLAVGFYSMVIFPRDTKTVNKLKEDLNLCLGGAQRLQPRKPSKKPPAKPSGRTRVGPLPTQSPITQNNSPAEPPPAPPPAPPADQDDDQSNSLDDGGSSTTSSSSDSNPCSNKSSTIDKDGQWEPKPFEIEYCVPTPTQWKRYQEEGAMSCWLHVETLYTNIELHLAMNEIYCGAKFCHNKHGCRILSGNDKSTVGVDKMKGLFIIPKETPLVINSEIQVVRPNSNIWKKMPEVNLSLLINTAIFLHQLKGKAYNYKRSEHAIQIPFGLVNPCRQWSGFPLLQRCKELNDWQKDIFLTHLGMICDNISIHIDEFQRLAGKQPLCQNEDRDKRYAARFRQKLKLAPHSRMRKETAFLTFSPIGPNHFPHNKDHCDTSNPVEDGYHETGCHSQVVTTNGVDMYLFQVIIASRKWISRDCVMNEHSYDPLSDADGAEEGGDADEAEEGAEELEDKEDAEETGDGDYEDETGNHKEDHRGDDDKQESIDDDEETENGYEERSHDDDDDDDDESEIGDASKEDEATFLNIGEELLIGFVDKGPGGQLELKPLRNLKIGMVMYVCPYIPVDLLAPLVQYYKSDTYMEKFKNCTGIVNHSSGKGSASPPHAEYLMSGPSNWHENESNLMHAIQKALELETGHGFSYNDCGCIRTVNGMYHQPSHVDHGKALQLHH